MPKKSDFFWLSWHFEMIKISLCEGHHIWESVNSNTGLTAVIFMGHVKSDNCIIKRGHENKQLKIRRIIVWEGLLGL